MENKKLEARFVTPIGIARFPWLTQADTRYNADGVYKVDLVLTEDEATPLIAKIDALWEDFRKTLTGPKAKKAPLSLGYAEEYDDNDKPTGNYILKVKTNAMMKRKDGTSEHRRLVFVDSKAKEFTPEPIWGGSKLKLNITAIPYDAGANLGISLKLNAVQVIELVSGGNGGGSFGFGEEDGFVNEGSNGFNSVGADEEDDF